MSQVAPQTFDLIGRELNASLAEARTPLETFIEQPDNFSLLERSAAELHRVQGVLRVLEIYGAALLAEEMEQVTRYVIASAAEKKAHAESLDALLRAMVQLPSYLDRVLAGGRDLALVLLPLLNDLRAVRGSPLLSEGTLLLLNLKSDRKPSAGTDGELPDAAPTVSLAARRLRTQFQLGLVGWIRGEREDENLGALASVSQQMEQVATQQPVFQLWWVVGAVIEALRENGLEGSVSVKRLLGLADRELKRLYEEGEPRYSQAPPVELLNNLLYYVARANSQGPRVTAVRGSFRLDELLPVDQAVEEERDTLSAPSIKLMQTVAAAIREDLGKVKDTLDIFVRRGQRPGRRARSAGRAAAQDRRHARRARPRRAARQHPEGTRATRGYRRGARAGDGRRAGRDRDDADQCRGPARWQSAAADRAAPRRGIDGRESPRPRRRRKTSCTCSPRCCANAR